MKITILNGNSDAENGAFDDYLGHLSTELGSEGHAVTLLELREMEIKHCTGCFGCWVKTPGECVVTDESPTVLRAIIKSDFVLWASPVSMGFYSALLKKMTDKVLPLIHPYMMLVEGELHHIARYDKYLLGGLLLEKSGDTDDQDIALISATHGRTMLNFKSKLAFTGLMSSPVEETARGISRSIREGGTI